MYVPRSQRLLCLLTLLAILLTLPGMSLAQEPEFESLLYQREMTCILDRGEKVLGGLDGGGLLLWDRDNLENVTWLTAGHELSGNDVTAMAWTGRHVWVATMGGGMTRIDNLEGTPVYRQYASNLGSLNITAVTGQVIGEIERVYYGMNAGGVGVITEGLSGAIYTAEQDGLIDNNINDLQIFNGELFVATPSGVSRFANNLFGDVNQGLTNLNISALATDPLGRLVCAGDGGVYYWNGETEAWVNLAWSGGIVTRLASNDEALWALGPAGGTGRLGFHNGTNWTYTTPPRSGAVSLDAGSEVWVGGRYREEGMSSSTAFAWSARLDGVDVWTEKVLDASLVFNPCGIAFDSEGTRWLGSFTGKAISGVGEASFDHIFRVAATENDSTGLFNQYSNILAMAADGEGLVYAAQYTSGLVRHDIRNGETDLIWPGNSGLQDRFVVNLLTHPDGPLFIMHDAQDGQTVEVLIDPEHWRGDGNWIQLPSGEQGMGAGIAVFDAVVQRRDVIWFAVEGTGLVRWDVNGQSAGPDDPLTWSDFSDDYWVGPIDDVTGTANDPGLAVALDVAPDGSLWFGGNGVTRVEYDPVFGTLELIEAYGAKTAAFQAGLITGNVADLAVDANGDCWVATSAGLNRIAWGSEEPQIDAWFDLGGYFSNSTYPLLYSPNVITGLPGGIYYRLIASSDRQTMALSSSKGAVAWDVQEIVVETDGSLAEAYFYPNPFLTSDDAPDLKLGGIPAEDSGEDAAVVEIYNLEGQLVYRNSHVSQDDGFWGGVNRLGNPVASGMYVLKLTWRNEVTTRTLAVVR